MKYKYFQLPVFLFIIFFAPVSVARAATTLFETAVNPNISIGWGGNSGTVIEKVAVRYVAPANQSVCTVSSKVTRGGTYVTSSAILNVREGGSTPEGGTLLATTSLASSSFSIGFPNQYVTFTLPACLPFTANQVYWFTFEPSPEIPFRVLFSANYVTAGRASDEFSYSSAWQLNGSAFLGGRQWVEVANKEWSLKLEGSDAKQPVIIVPGILGTRLNRVSDGEEVWPNFSKMLLPGNNHDEYLNELILDSTGQLPNDVIEPTKILDKVSLSSVYGNLINTFVDSSYIVDKNLFVVPYDWRLDIENSKQRLTDVIQASIAQSPTGKVNIIAHSLGGVLVKEFLRTATSTEFLDKLILAGVPEVGSPKAFKALTYGDNFGFKFGPIDFFDPLRSKIISQNMPAVYQLLPSRNYLASIGSFIVDYTDSTLGALDYDQSHDFMLKDVSDSRNPALLSRADSFHQTLDSAGFNFPASSTYRISGCQNPSTIGNVRVYSNDKFDIDSVDGDGTVPLKSATYSMGGSNNYFALYSQTGIDHMGLVSDSRTVNLMRDIVSGFGAPVAPAGVSTQQSDCGLINPSDINGKVFSFSTHSPVNLHVYDSQGRHLGPNADGDIEFGIPGGNYEQIGENNFAFVPGGQTYRVVADATNKGSFDLKEKIFEGAALKNVVTYLAVPLKSASTSAEVQLGDIGSQGLLQLDVEGDGVVDQAIVSTAVLTDAEVSDAMPPVIDLQSPEELDYVRSEIIPLTANVTDENSGVATSVISLDGILKTGSTTIDLFFEKLGNHHLGVSAYDNAGNLSLAEADFTVSADATSTIANIERAFSLGWIKKKDVKKDLIGDLKSIIKLEKKIVKLQAKVPIPGKPGKTKKIEKQIEKLGARVDRILGKNFINELEKKYKKQLITVEAYNLLKENVEWMMNN